MTQHLLLALGLVLVIEGLLYALVPRHLLQMLELLKQKTDDQLRVMGIGTMAVGVAVVWIIRSIYLEN
jgi:uncharacterized protein